MIIHLVDCVDKDPEEVGYKAKNLGWLITNGFKCPLGFVIPSDVFSGIINQYFSSKINEIISIGFFNIDAFFSTLKADLKRSDSVNVDFYFGDFREKIKEKIIILLRHCPLKQEVENELNMFGCKYAYARSSTNYSDSPKGTYAGVFKSFPFEIEKLGNIFEDMISEIISSIFSGDTFNTIVLRYDEILKDYMETIKIAIIFQEMKEKEPYVSGHIRFNGEEAIIEMVQGLGEAIMPYLYRLIGDEDILRYKKQKGKIREIPPLCIAHYDSNKPIRFSLKPQEYMYTINQKDGWGTECISLEPQKRISNKEEVKKMISSLLNICEKIKKMIRVAGDLLIEFVIWHNKESQIVQLRTPPRK